MDSGLALRAPRKDGKHHPLLRLLVFCTIFP